MAFRPCLCFGRHCRDAFTRYQEVFGGEPTLITMTDIPDQQDVPPENADLCRG